MSISPTLTPPARCIRMATRRAWLEALIQATQLEPREPVLLNNLGYGMCTLGACNAGIQALKEASVKDNLLWEAFYNLGKTYVDEALYEPAAKHLDHALALKPD